MNRPYLSVVLLLTFSISSISYAGRVRTLKMNDKKMERVNLSLGKSTVLRFKSGRPQKIVVGNKNYYQIEFIGNDVTIQPLAVIPTNLFVYTEYQVYGFLLTTKKFGFYDDLVNVKWRSDYVKYLPVNRRKKTIKN